MTAERDFLKQVVELSHMYGWLAFSVDKSARLVRGRYISNITGDKGFPDLVLCRPPRLVLAELKTGKVYGKSRGGKYTLTEDQKRWRDALRSVPGAEWYEWLPDGLEEIEAALRP